jgi:hypothetical protein
MSIEYTAFWESLNDKYGAKLATKDQFDLCDCEESLLTGRHINADWFLKQSSNLGRSLDEDAIDSFFMFLRNAKSFSLTKKSLQELPDCAGLYFFWVHQGWRLYRPIDIDPSDDPFLFQEVRPLYIGMTSNLSNRFVNHHRMNEVRFLQMCGIGVELQYLPENDLFQFRNLELTEAKLIKNLFPILNGNSINNVALDSYRCENHYSPNVNRLLIAN